MKELLILSVFFFFSTQLTFATTTIVINTNDSGVGSLREAVSLSNNKDTIRFDSNIINLGNDTIKLATPIIINKNMVIIGLYNSSATLYISGQNNNQIFNADLSSVNSPTQKDLTLDSLRFINGNSSSGGGAVYFKGFHLNLSNSIFSNNTSSAGGAITSTTSYGVVTINDCIFNSNTASSFGGGVYAGGQVIIYNSDCHDNEAASGGAIFSTRKMTIEGSTFMSNTAADNGGAVCLSSNTSTTYYPFSVINSTFQSNTANFGGAIYSYFYNTEVDLNIDNSTFDSNHSIWAGGAVMTSCYWYLSSIDINNSNIINNTSDDSSAGIHCGAVHKNATITADSCFVNGNVALGTGGGISVSTSTDTSSPSDTAFLHVSNSTITNNSASKGGGLNCSGTGGASGTSVLTLDNSIVSDNTASIEGGGVYTFASANNELGSYPARAYTTINSSTINNNHADANGGGIYSNSYSASSSGASQSFIFVNQSTLVKNTAVDDGGAIGNYSRNNGFLAFGPGVSIDVKNATIYNNNAANGGAFSSRFSSYWSASDPGAMAVQIASSIIAFNGENAYNAADSIVSLGYNIFSEDTVIGSIASDQMEVDSVALSLGVLQINGGFTPTLLPSLTSPAINNGNPIDVSDAQNAPVSGIRDVGAAESFAILMVNECDSFVAPSGNITYYSSGFYTDTVVVLGVDSLIFINLSINKTYSTLTETICAGEAYTSPSGDMHSISSDFIDTIPNHLSCDSIITISLTVLNESYSSIDTIACGNYTSPSGVQYGISGIYNDTILNTAGCDSIITINLSFGNTSSTLTATECFQFTSVSGNIYYSSGVYTDTIPNASGCDSIVTLTLTILDPSSGTDIQSVCNSFDWIDGITYTSSNNIAQWTLTNAAGCDSIVTLNLTILTPSAGTDIQTACDSFDWIDGNTYTSDNNTAQWTLTNAAGCDSIVTLNLTMTNVEIGTTQIDDLTIQANAVGANYKWLNCDDNYSIIAGETNQTFTATLNGNYAVEVTQNGCTDTSDCVVINSVGVLENGLTQSVLIYPNPTNGKVRIRLSDKANSIQTVKVKNVLMQIVSSNSNTQTSEVEIEVIGTPGVYFFEIESSNGKLIKRRIVKL